MDVAEKQRKCKGKTKEIQRKYKANDWECMENMKMIENARKQLTIVGNI